MAEPVTARQNAIYDCTHIYLDAFDKKGPIGDLYSKAVAEYLERFTKTENCFMYTLIEKDVIVGFLTACEIPGILSRSIKIDTVAIAPEYQNKGYGTVMMNEFFNMFENAVFSLETIRNSISYKLYSKVGFKEVNGCSSMCKYDSKNAAADSNIWLSAALDRIVISSFFFFKQNYFLLVAIQ